MAFAPYTTEEYINQCYENKGLCRYVETKSSVPVSAWANLSTDKKYVLVSDHTMFSGRVRMISSKYSNPLKMIELPGASAFVPVYERASGVGYLFVRKDLRHRIRELFCMCSLQTKTRGLCQKCARMIVTD